jgi:hypothetical protein
MSGNLRKFVAAAALVSLGCVLGGCNNAFQGGAAGAALGSLAGMGLGSLTGNMGAGAAAGAIIGGLGGAIIGDQNARTGTYVDYGVAPLSSTTYVYGAPGYPAPAAYYYGPPRPAPCYRPLPPPVYHGGYYVRSYGGCDY